MQRCAGGWGWRMLGAAQVFVRGAAMCEGIQKYARNRGYFGGTEAC